VTLFTLTACEEKSDEKPSSIVAIMKDDTFELKMYNEKLTYTNDEVINCYATLEYIGEEDSITVYSSDPLVGFALKDDKYFDGGYSSNDELLTTIIKKGEILRFNYLKTGGWTNDDPNADFYEKFYSEKELVLPAGKYEISSTIECSLDSKDIMGSKYKTSVSTYITVVK